MLDTEDVDVLDRVRSEYRWGDAVARAPARAARRGHRGQREAAGPAGRHPGPDRPFRDERAAKSIRLHEAARELDEPGVQESPRSTGAPTQTREPSTGRIPDRPRTGDQSMSDAMRAETVRSPGTAVTPSRPTWPSRSTGHAGRGRGGDPPHARLRRGDQGDHADGSPPTAIWPSAPTSTTARPPEPAPTTPRPRPGPRAACPTSGWWATWPGRPPISGRSSSSNGKVATIGYCSGGRQSFLAACSLALDAAVDCYGAFVLSRAARGPAARASGPSSTWPRICRARCSGCSGPRTSTRPPTRWPSSSRLLTEGRQDVRVPHLRGGRPRLLRHRPAQLPARGGQRGMGADLGLLRPPPGYR